MIAARAVLDALDLGVLLERARRLLGSHHAAPEAACAHGPDPADPDDTISLYAFVAAVDRRRLGVREGPPCSGPFEELDLGWLGLVAASR